VDGGRLGDRCGGQLWLDVQTMSLINKMLQDLDARGGARGDAGAHFNVQPVAYDESRSPLLVAGGALLLAALAAGTYFGWRALQRPPAVAASVPTPLAPVKTVVLAPLVEALPAPAAAAAPVEVAAPPEPAAALEPVAPRARAPRTASGDDARGERRAQLGAEKKRLVADKLRAAAPPAKPRAAAPAAAAPPAASNLSALGAAARAEAEYRRALVTMQEGRIDDAIASLELALQIDPRHDAARQTLVALLIEARRPDEAARQLQQALGANPRQPALAMLLARLQIERGSTGIDTLQRTLPYAAANADYHAFLAGALQRQLRHREAAEQFQAALRLQPNNGVWQMGLGISLQAEKRNPEALEAFQSARAAASLSPELQALVERKVQQLSR
jgi:MSHA biogenesis protein MshN